MPQGRVCKYALCLQPNLARSISEIPDFPNDPSPCDQTRFGKLENWETGTWLEVHISQFPNFPKEGQHDLGNWEIGKWPEVHISQFPSFPNDPSPCGPVLFGKFGNGLEIHISQFLISQMIPAHLAQHYLGNWEMVTSTYFPISQFPTKKSPNGSALSGKLGNRYRYILPNFPISQNGYRYILPNKKNSPNGPALFGK